MSLEAEFARDEPLEVGNQDVPLNVRIVNTTDAPVPVVQLGDGSSQEGWREPYVFYTVERFTPDGAWKGVPEPDQGRCGVHDEDWSDEVETLGAGARLGLDVDWASTYFNLQEPGPHRVRVHYRFQSDHPTQSPPVASTGMAGESSYELVSAPVTFQVVEPLEVRLDAVKSVKAHVPVQIQDVFRLEVHNVSAKTRQVELAVGNNVRFEMVGHGSSPLLSYARANDPPTYDLASGAKLVVMGPGSKMPTPQSSWTVDAAGTYLMRVRYEGVNSNWTKVTVE